MIGIFGGTFNPPHIGHLILAAESIHILGLERVIFVPVGIPPHVKTEVLPPGIRYRMTLLAAAGDDKFIVSDYEIKKDVPSYTIDTLSFFSRKYKDNILFLMGMDSLQELTGWKDHETILDNFNLAVWKRPGFSADEVNPPIVEKVKIIETMNIPISSSDIRLRIKESRPFRHMVSGKVFSYIEALGLYK